MPVGRVQVSSECEGTHFRGGSDHTVRPKSALDVVYDRSAGIPAVIVAALAELVGLAAYRYAEIDDPEISADVAERIDYADPHADEPEQS